MAFDLLFRVFSLGETIAAVDRTVFAGLEGNLGFLAAGSADGGEHFTLGLGGVLAGVTASFASLGLVLETLFSIEFLLTGGEHKFLAAFFAHESLVFVHCCLPHLDDNDFALIRIWTVTFAEQRST